MSSELESLKQRITELEAENAELRKENTEICDLRFKLSVSDAEIAELKRRNAETLRSNAEYNERREFRDRLTKVEQSQSLIDNTPIDNTHTSKNNSSNFNSGADHHEKSSQEKEMDIFLDEEDKKIV